MNVHIKFNNGKLYTYHHADKYKLKSIHFSGKKKKEGKNVFVWKYIFFLRSLYIYLFHNFMKRVDIVR